MIITSFFDTSLTLLEMVVVFTAGLVFSVCCGNGVVGRPGLSNRAEVAALGDEGGDST